MVEEGLCVPYAWLLPILLGTTSLPVGVMEIAQLCV